MLVKYNTEVERVGEQCTYDTIENTNAAAGRPVSLLHFHSNTHPHDPRPNRERSGGEDTLED
jgi:hypothetical protein